MTGGRQPTMTRGGGRASGPFTCFETRSIAASGCSMPEIVHPDDAFAMLLQFLCHRLPDLPGFAHLEVEEKSMSAEKIAMLR